MSRRAESVVYEDREYYREAPPARAPPVRTRERDYEEVDTYTRRERAEPERDRRLDFLREDYGRRAEAGPMVVRETDVYTSRSAERRRSPSPVERERVRTTRVVERARSPSPVRVRERVVERARSLSPVERVRTRTVISERPPSPEPERLRKRVVETRERVRERSPSPVRIRERIVERERSPSPVRIRERIIERERERSPSPPRIERISIREKAIARAPSPSPSPSPPRSLSPGPIRAPPIHQEIITHHRHIDHGYERARAPSPPPPPRRSEARTKETDIDIYTSRNNTEIDIKQTSNARARTPQPTSRREMYEEDTTYADRERLRVSSSDTRVDVRRSSSARPSNRLRVDIDDEAEYYNRKVEERAYIGEAYNGATKDWAIVDVPPGTERVRMDGVGGGGQEITWQRYNGVRRSKFLPERERERDRERERVEIKETSIEQRPRERETSGLEIEISSSSRRREGGGKTYEREYERIEESSDRRVSTPRGPKNRPGELWTEITKDLVLKEALESMGYDYEETDFFFYVMQYLRYEDVLQLVQLSETIKRERQDRLREIERERMWMERGGGRREREREREVVREREMIMPPPGYEQVREVIREPAYDDERIIEREVVYGERRRRGF